MTDLRRGGRHELEAVLADAPETIRRYERLVEAVIASETRTALPAFSVSYPARIEGAFLIVEENVEGDSWRMRSIVCSLL